MRLSQNKCKVVEHRKNISIEGYKFFQSLVNAFFRLKTKSK